MRSRGRAVASRCSARRVGGSWRALAQAGADVVVAREPTAQLIAERGLRVQQRHVRRLHRAPARACARLQEPVDALIVATKAAGLEQARCSASRSSRKLVLPLLNGLDHLAVLRERFAPDTVARGHDPRRGRPARAGRGRPHEPVPARSTWPRAARPRAPGHGGAGADARGRRHSARVTGCRCPSAPRPR